MDFKKCRTCFIDLDANDLFLKLDQIYKKSKLCLGEKLKLCVPQMDLKYSDKLYICMQCSMHLETAYTFRMTCLKTEEEFQRHVSQMFHNNSDSKKSHKDYLKEEEKKDIDDLHCLVCNIHFSSRNIFDLHMKVMHPINEIMYKRVDERLSVSKSKEIKHQEMQTFKATRAEILKNKQKTEVIKDKKIPEILKDKENENTRPLVQMVVLQTNIESSLMKEKNRNSKDNQTKRQRTIEKLKEKGKTAANALKRASDGRFLPRSKSKTTTQKMVNTKSHLNNMKVNTRIIKKSKQNMSTNNVNIPTLKCKFCSKMLTTPAALTIHLITIHKDKCNRCNICKRYFLDVNQHKKKYACHLKCKPTQRKLYTKKKGYSLSKKKEDNLKLTNIRYHFSEDARFYYIDSGDKLPTCLVCKKKHHTESTLKSHIASSHNGGIQCSKCELRFSACNLSIHKVIGCERSPYFNYTTDGECICPLCNRVMDKVTTLYRHLLIHHSTDKLKCNKCHKISNTFRLFGEHIALGCRKTYIKAEQQSDGTVFVEMIQESNNSQRTLTQPSIQDDPLATNLDQRAIDSALSDSHSNQADCSNISEIGSSNTTIATVLDRNVKVEPTELLDQNTYMLGENVVSNDLCAAMPELNLQYLNDEDEITDSPELVYVLAQKENN